MARAWYADAQHARTISMTAASPFTSTKLSCIPANENCAVSSAVADDRTATAEAELPADRPRYAVAIASRTSWGISLWSTSARAFFAVAASRFESSMSRSRRSAVIAARSPDATANRSYASTSTTKPAGTGNPAAVSSPRLAPLPPADATSRRVRSANARTNGVAFAGEITGGTTGDGIGLVEGALRAGFAVGMSGIRRYREMLVEPIPCETRELLQRP